MPEYTRRNNQLKGRLCTLSEVAGTADGIHEEEAGAGGWKGTMHLSVSPSRGWLRMHHRERVATWRSMEGVIGECGGGLIHEEPLHSMVTGGSPSFFFVPSSWCSIISDHDCSVYMSIYRLYGCFFFV